jgi:hypothetical protein
VHKAAAAAAAGSASRIGFCLWWYAAWALNSLHACYSRSAAACDLQLLQAPQAVLAIESA